MEWGATTGEMTMRVNERCKYENDGERITASGKFEGQPVFAPYFWKIALDGMADRDDGFVFTFKLLHCDSDFNRWPTLRAWLGRKRTLRIREDSQGFVSCW